LFQPRPVPATPFVERLRGGAGRRALGLGLAVLIEALLVLLLLTLVSGINGREKERPSEVSLTVQEVSENAPEPNRPEQRQRARPEFQRPQPEQPHPPSPTPPAPTPAPPAPTPIIPLQFQLAPGEPRNTEPAAPPARHVVSAFGDSERVGTAPNGEPLYAAEWYREPDHHMLGTYLSTAQGPGWGLIACRTAPDYRVEDCVPLEEYPHGSQINRSVLAAAWEFRVRPPRRGGQPLVGSWVRIRIDYDFSRR
jgi:protein TonB